MDTDLRARTSQRRDDVDRDPRADLKYMEDLPGGG
jgi:hypothetical protein